MAEREWSRQCHWNLTAREMHYVGTRCQWLEPATKKRPCWNPATYRVQRGAYTWWFVCFAHIEAVIVSYHGLPDMKDPHKSHVRTLCTSPAAAAWARLVYEIGRYSRRALKAGGQ